MDDEVGKYASYPLLVVSPEYSVREVARVMACMNIRRVAVTENGKVIGIIASSDLTRLIGEKPIDDYELRCSVCGRTLSSEDRYNWCVCTVCKRVACLNCVKYELVRDVSEDDLGELGNDELKLKPMKAFPICLECYSHREVL